MGRWPLPVRSAGSSARLAANQPFSLLSFEWLPNVVTQTWGHPGAFMIRTSLIALSALSVTACNAANLTSVYRQPDLNRGQSLVLDAEQFVVINRGDQTCVMPSPDGLSSVAASGGLLAEVTGQSGQGGASTSASLSESAAYIGLRTQSIQLLRDTLFTLCLQAQNGQLDAFNSAVLMRRYQSQLVAVLAVEQLTGAVTAGGGSTFTSAGATPGDFVLGLTAASSDITRRQGEITNRLGQIGAHLDDPETGASQRQALISERTRLQQEQSDLSAAGTVVSDALTDIAAGDSSAAGAALSRAAAIAPNVFQTNNTAAIAAVAQSVENIVTQVAGADHSASLCFEYFRAGPQSTGYRPHAEGDLSEFCNGVLDRVANPTMERLVGQYVTFVSQGDFQRAQAMLTLIQALGGDIPGPRSMAYERPPAVMTPYPGGG